MTISFFIHFLGRLKRDLHCWSVSQVLVADTAHLAQCLMSGSGYRYFHILSAAVCVYVVCILK